MITSIVRAVAGVACWLLLAGCGGSGELETYAVSGTVTLDGAPLETGDITFRPAGPTGQGAGGKIVNGIYSLRTTPGEMHVEVSSMKYLSGQTSDNPAGAGAPLFEDRVPPKYNSETTLTFTVQPGEENDFSIEMTH